MGNIFTLPIGDTKMWLDIVLLVLIVLCALVGLFKGFFDSLLSLFGNLVSVVIAYFLAKYVASFLNSTFKVSDYVVKLLTKWGVSEGGIIGFSRVKLANTITFVLSIIVIWILLRLAILLLSKLFSSVTSNSSAISGLNRLFGFIFGAVKGFAFVVIGFGLCAIVTTFLPDSTNQKFNSFMKANPVSHTVYVKVADWTGKHLKDKIDKAISQLEKDVENTTDGSVDGDNASSVESAPIVVSTSPLISQIDESYLN